MSKTMTENQILPTTNVRVILEGMKVGDEVKFPLEKIRYIRVISSETGIILGRKYRTCLNRPDKYISVIREQDPE